MVVNCWIEDSSTISDMRVWFTKSDRITVVHHYPMYTVIISHFWYTSYIVRPIGLTNNCCTSCLCGKDLDNICVAEVLYKLKLLIANKIWGKDIFVGTVYPRNITQWIHYTTKLSWTNISQTTAKLSWTNISKTTVLYHLIVVIDA